jgi:hypothetical protein
MSEFNPNAKDGGFERELIPSGTHAARCARVIEIGKQYSKLYDNESNKVIIVLSLPHVLINMGGEEKQAFVSNPFGITISNNDRSSMKQYTRALDPKGEAKSLGDFLNKTCQVLITHRTKGDGKVFAQLDSVAPILPGFEVPDLDTDPLWFRWNSPDAEVWKKLPDFQKNLIKEATNYHGSKVWEMVNDVEGGSDIPM